MSNTLLPPMNDPRHFSLHPGMPQWGKNQEAIKVLYQNRNCAAFMESCGLHLYGQLPNWRWVRSEKIFPVAWGEVGNDTICFSFARIFLVRPQWVKACQFVMPDGEVLMTRVFGKMQWIAAGTEDEILFLWDLTWIFPKDATLERML